MKILYAVQATGNGHISRAIELLPYMEQYGKVDIFLSGSNSHLNTDQLPVKFRSKGISLFYSNSGGLNYSKIVNQLSIKSIFNEARQLPVEEYDLIINDFEPITSLACKLKKVESVGFGHQASFQSKLTPRPAVKNWMGEWVLQHYATATKYIGLHFDNYADFIYSPILKQSVLNASPTNAGHITVYLSHYHCHVLYKVFSKIPNTVFHVFNASVTKSYRIGNVHFLPIDNKLFSDSLISCEGIITGAGFETPAEALYLQKKLMVLPIRGQYEQACNAAALRKYGVEVVRQIDDAFVQTIETWLYAFNKTEFILKQQTEAIVDAVFTLNTQTSQPSNNWFKEIGLDEYDFFHLA